MSKIKQILDKYNLEYKYAIHKPIRTYQDAIEVDKEFGFTGVESKNLFIKDSNKNYYVFITSINVRFDRGLFKELFNDKFSLTDNNELNSITGYEVGSIPGFDYPSNITLIIDKDIFNHTKYICSAGIPTQSFEIEPKQLLKIYDDLDNKIIYIDLINKKILDRNQI